MDGQGHEAEVRNPTVEDEQSAAAAEATAAEAEMGNSTGGAGPGEGGQHEGEELGVDDELIDKAQKLMEKITSSANNPNPNILHALSHLLESQESLYVSFSLTFTLFLICYFLVAFSLSLTLTCIRRFLKENGYYSNDRGNHNSGKLCNLIRVSHFVDYS